jgi:GntR family transcriptional regulator
MSPTGTDHTMRVIGEPLRYQRIYRSIADRIASGELSKGDRLQSERDLSTAFGVGRTTVRRALAELERDGLVESSPGRGSFVAGGPLSESNVLEGLSELGAERGSRATSRVLVAELRPATLAEAESFAIVAGAPIFHLERVRLLDGLEIALADSLVPEFRVRGLTDVDFRSASLYAELDARGASPVRAEFTAWAAAADARTATLLSVTIGEPVLMTSTRACDATGRVIETSLVTYRADRYRLRTELTRRRRRAWHGA